MNARKTTLQEREALELANRVDEIYACRGKKVVHIDLKKAKPDRATLAGLLLGPTGNLRAPALIKGNILIIGFDQASYLKLFG